MDAATVRTRLQAEGIDVTFHRDGTMTAEVLKPREQSWSLWLRDRIRALPGAVVTLVRERPASDPYFAHNEVKFRLGDVNNPAEREVPREVAMGEGAVEALRELPTGHAREAIAELLGADRHGLVWQARVGSGSVWSGRVWRVRESNGEAVTGQARAAAPAAAELSGFRRGASGRGRAWCGADRSGLVGRGLASVESCG